MAKKPSQEAKKPSQKKNVDASQDKFRVKDHEVVITRRGDRETLQIDGRVVGFYHTESGYRLKIDLFRLPQKTLRDAVRFYLESETAQ